MVIFFARNCNRLILHFWWSSDSPWHCKFRTTSASITATVSGPHSWRCGPPKAIRIMQNGARQCPSRELNPPLCYCSSQFQLFCIFPYHIFLASICGTSHQSHIPIFKLWMPSTSQHRPSILPNNLKRPVLIIASMAQQSPFNSILLFFCQVYSTHQPHNLHLYSFHPHRLYFRCLYIILPSLSLFQCHTIQHNTVQYNKFFLSGP